MIEGPAGGRSGPVRAAVMAFQATHIGPDGRRLDGRMTGWAIKRALAT